MDDDPADVGDLVDELEELEAMVDAPAEREQVRETIEVALATQRKGGSYGHVIRGFDRADLAEALLGSILFGIPMAVEGGTQEVGAFLARHPAAFAGTVATTVGLVVGILYVAEIQDVRVHEPLFGVVPRRLVGVLGVSLVTAVALLTLWGRVDWTIPWLATANVAAAALPMSLGAALGDILPGT